jgi:hypothetical protein
METIQITRKRENIGSRNLVIPEPKQLWIANPKDKKNIIREAKQFWAEFRSCFGFQIPNNLSEIVFGSMPNSNKKFGKSNELIFGLSLAQSNLSGINVCWWSTKECRANCVGRNGNNGFPRTMKAKIAKTKFLFEHPEEAGIILADFWEKAQIKGETLGKEVGGRLNTFSDINWIETAPWIFERFQGISFYDYTKQWDRESPFKNYHLTYSASERTTDDDIIGKLVQGKNVAVVFNSWSCLPTEYLGFPVIDGDKTDVRWKDSEGVIVGLKRKGSLKASSPMVRCF